jgi:hypothetical protein
MIENNNVSKHRKVYDAIIHIVWIVIISIAMIILVDEIFHGSAIGNVVILILIAVYTIFSFARKFWIEKNNKRIMEAIDITLTLVGGIFMVMIYAGAQQSDGVGQALAQNVLNGKSQPSIAVFYIGATLLMVGIIRAVMINSKVIDRFKS